MLLIFLCTNNKYRDNVLLVSSILSFKFDNLDYNVSYSIEIGYEIYRNNVSFTEEQKTEINPYIDYIYTPIGSGITLGSVVISKLSDIAIRLEYVGSSNLSSIKKIIYKVNYKGTYSTSGTIEGNSIFTTSGDSVVRVMLPLRESNNPNYTLADKGTYNVTVTYYLESGEKVYSHTLPILVS